MLFSLVVLYTSAFFIRFTCVWFAGYTSVHKTHVQKFFFGGYFGWITGSSDCGFVKKKMCS